MPGQRPARHQNHQCRRIKIFGKPNSFVKIIPSSYEADRCQSELTLVWNQTNIMTSITLAAVIYFVDEHDALLIDVLRSPWIHQEWNIDGLVKSPNSVTPAKAGVQKLLKWLDSYFRRNDEKGIFRIFTRTLNIYSNTEQPAHTPNEKIVSPMGGDSTTLYAKGILGTTQ